MDSGSSLGVRTRSMSYENERRRATVTPDGASSTASYGSTDVASTTTSDDSGSSTPPARRVIHSNITTKSSYRDDKNRVDPLSPATRAACTRTYPDFMNIPDGLSPMAQRAFMQADLAAYNAELEARRATDDALGNNLSYMRTRLQPPSTLPSDAYDADDEAGEEVDTLENPWGHDFEPFRPQRSLLTPIDPRQAFVNAVETVLPAIDVAHPPSLESIRQMSPWEREVRVEAHREAMRRRHRAQMGERRYARAAAAGWRVEETEYEAENMVIEATRGFGGLAFERPEVFEESSSSEEEEEEVEVVRGVVVISDDDDEEDDGEDDGEDDDDLEDNDEDMEDFEDDEDLGDDEGMSRKRIKLESASPPPPAKRLRRSVTSQGQSSPEKPKFLSDDLDYDLQLMKWESEEEA